MAHLFKTVQENGRTYIFEFTCGCDCLTCVLKHNLIVFSKMHLSIEKEFLQSLGDETFVKNILRRFSKSVIEVVVSTHEMKRFLSPSKYWVSSPKSLRFFCGELSVACFQLPSCDFTTLCLTAPYQDPCQKYLTFFTEYRVVGPNVLSFSTCDWFKRVRVKSRFFSFQESSLPLDKCFQYTLDIVDNSSEVPILVFGKLGQFPFDPESNSIGLFDEDLKRILRQCAHAHAIKISDHDMSKQRVSYLTAMHFGHEITMF